MTQLLLVFCSQAFMVLCLGLQSLTVNQGIKTLAAINSLCLGVMGFYLTSVIAQANVHSVGTSVWFAYILAGPVGIVSSMLFHPYLARFVKSLTTRKDAANA